jgi:hypothetical protein
MQNGDGARTSRSAGFFLSTSVPFLVLTHRLSSMMPDLGAAVRDATVAVATVLTTL